MTEVCGGAVWFYTYFNAYFLFTKKHLGTVSVNNIKSSANESNYELNNW